MEAVKESIENVKSPEPARKEKKERKPRQKKEKVAVVAEEIKEVPKAEKKIKKQKKEKKVKTPEVSSEEEEEEAVEEVAVEKKPFVADPIDVSKYDLAAMKKEAFCFKCSYLKDSEGKREFVYAEGKTNHYGKPLKVYKYLKRAMHIKSADNLTRNNKTVRVIGECENCHADLSLICKKEDIPLLADKSN